MRIMLTKDVKEALEAERRRYRAQRERLDAKIEALDAVLAPDDQLGFFESEVRVVSLDEGQAEGSDNGSVAGMGLRGAMRHVLRQYVDGLTARVLAEKLEQLGWTATGTTSVQTRVAGEASKMRRRGMLQKRNRRYVLPIST